MNAQKTILLKVSNKILEQKPILPKELISLKNFEKLNKPHPAISLLKKVAVPGSLIFGFIFTAFPIEFEQLVNTLPAWTNFTPTTLNGINYIWDLLGDPVKKANILYHLPNIILYSFGIFGIKKLIDVLDRRTWLDKVYTAKQQLIEQIKNGTLSLKMLHGHSILFLGTSDFIGMQLTRNLPEEQTITIASKKPYYTDIWNYYDIETLFEDLQRVLKRVDTKNAGEYIFFPVKDDQIFLPNDKAYDLSPHKLDILVQNIRVIEMTEGWKPKRIIIIGDKFHKSYVHSEDQRRIIERSRDIISLSSISKKYQYITLLDPTDIVLKEIIKIAKGRKVLFRATLEGIKEYKKRFYHRLKILGYTPDPKKKGNVTIGYDLFEDQTEQQTLSKKINSYFPIVLSKPVKDALLRNGYKEHEFLYVPDLVIKQVLAISQEQ